MIKYLFDGNYLVERIQIEKKDTILVALPVKRGINPAGAVHVKLIKKPVSFNDKEKFDLIDIGDILIVDIARLMDFDDNGFEIINEKFIMGLWAED